MKLQLSITTYHAYKHFEMQYYAKASSNLALPISGSGIAATRTNLLHLN